jgi:hypothetical protein
MTLKVSVKLVDQLEINRFLSLFKVIQPRLEVPIELCSYEDANVIISDSDLHRYQNTTSPSAGKLAVAYGARLFGSSGLTIDKPVKLAELVVVLNRAARNLGETEKHSDKNTQLVDRSTGLEPVGKLISPSDTDELLSILTDQQQKNIVSIEKKKIGKIYVDIRRGVCFGKNESSNRVVEKLLSKRYRNQDFIVMLQDADDFQQYCDENLLSCWRLGELVWRIVFYHASDQLLEGYSKKELVRLKQWPNLTRLPHTPAQTRLCALMSQEKNSLENFVIKAQVSVEEAIQFYNACALTGLLHRYRQNVKREPIKRPDNIDEKSILSKIIKHLFG